MWLGPVIEETLYIDISIDGEIVDGVQLEQEVLQQIEKMSNLWVTEVLDIENNLTAGHYVIMFAEGHGNYILHDFPSVTEFDGDKLSLKVVSFQGKYILSKLNYDEIEDYGSCLGFLDTFAPTVWFLKVNDNGERIYVEHTPTGLRVWSEKP